MDTRTEYSSIVFDHIVEFKQDDCLFGAGRETTSGKTRLFLIFNGDGRVYSRNGRADSWESLNSQEALFIHQLASQTGIPRYSVSGSYRSIN